MDRATWQKVAALFEAALEKPPAERPDFLAAACADRPELRAEVEALLAAHDQDGSELASPAHDLAPDLAAGLAGDGAGDSAGDSAEDSATTPPPPSLAGLRLGPYRLHEAIGHGGMAEVYRATRDDDQYHREVAVKLVKPGLRLEQVEQRFRVERQILAQLEHPNIATLLDGGVTEDGRPYLVMPYVKGQPITEYAAAARLTVSERLQLLRTVCDAVQFAHTNLVVHRDLKPSNILVTEQGEVRLLDFGIAKLLDPGSLEVTVAHTGDARLLTPDYAAPEQLRGEAITTATDVHALGVLLYELLTGQRPYRGTTLLELQRSVCEDAAPRPSTVATHPLGGDLDAIVMMALRKEPQRRYVSAGQLGDDLGRALSGRPVVARPDTVGYRLRKFLGRNRLSMATAATMALLLIWATIFSTQQSQQRAEALAVAEAERDKAQQLSEFLIDIFRESEPAAGQDVTARQLLDAGARRLGFALDARPLVQAEMAQAIGEAYGALGLYDQADSMLAVSFERRHGLLAPGQPDLAAAWQIRAALRAAQGRYTEALAAVDSAHACWDAVAQPDLAAVNRLYDTEVSALLETGQYERAHARLDEIRDLLTAAVGPDAPQLVPVERGYGKLATREKRHEDALRHHRRSLELFPDSLARVHPHYYDLLESTALALSNTGQLDSALAIHRETLTGRERIYGPDHPYLAYSLHNLGRTLGRLERYDEAIPYYERAMAIREHALGPDHPSVAHALESLAIANAMSGDLAAAEPQFLRSLAIYEAAFGPRHPETVESMANLAYLCNVMHRPEDTLTWLERAVDAGWHDAVELREGPYAGLAGNPRYEALLTRLEGHSEPQE